MEEMQPTGGLQQEGGGPNAGGNPWEEKPESEPGKPSSLVTIVTVIIVVALIIIVSNAIRENQGEETANPTVSTDNETGLTVEVIDSKIEETAVSADFLTPAQFTDTARAEKVINSSQGKNAGTTSAEYLQAGIVADLQEAGMYYFATATPNPKSNFVGIYKYNVKNAYWQRLFKQTFAQDPNGDTGMLRVLGQSGRDLIVLRDTVGRQDSACTSLWLLGEQDGYKLLVLNLDAPLDGLQDYTLPAAVKTAEEAKVAACQAK
jgi:hypothetical protein